MKHTSNSRMIDYNFNINDEMIINEDGYIFLHRDISWLSFNYRVLQEAMDNSVPLFERIRFLAIYSSNLDEFFRVRMANHKNLLRLGRKTERELEFASRETIKEVQRIVNEQQEIFTYIFENQIIPALKEFNIYINTSEELSQAHATYIENYFQDHLLPFVQPVLLIKNKIRPFLNNASLYLLVLLKDKEQGENEEVQYAIVKIPSGDLPRFIELPVIHNRKDIIMLDDVVRHNLPWMFPGYDVKGSYSIKLTRDAELYVDDEFSGDIVQKIRESLAKRQVGLASRLVYDRKMPSAVLEYIQSAFDLDMYDIFAEGKHHNNFDFFKFPNFNISHPGFRHQPHVPLAYKPLEFAPDFFTAMKTRDHLLHYPYHSYEAVVQFFEKAAVDPNVTHIKIVQYRVAKESRIMEALIKAVRTGKEVSVFIEVKARFDEEANLAWGEKLKQAGVEVHYSFPGVKVHTKMALVCRQEGEEQHFYVYLSTGNFHEETAKIYSDQGFFTANKRMVSDVAKVFAFLETVKLPQNGFDLMLVGQFNLRQELEALIDYEIEQARLGKPAHIILKLNNLQDKKMIVKLYDASRAGVKIKLIIRSICCLVPGIPGLSENIEAISIVDRFLEHSRIFMFYHSGQEMIYLSSADWMVRNLSFRVETAFPVIDPKLKKEIKEIINAQWNDNVKARVLDKGLKNKFSNTGPEIAQRSQFYLYHHFKRKSQQE